MTSDHASAGRADAGEAARPLRVATVITRLEGGAGVLALHGARALARHGGQPTIVTGSGGPLIEAAAAAGVEVLIEPALRAPLAPRSDLRALKRIELLLGGADFDVVHTHCAKAGAVGRLAARRAGVSRIVHTYHGFPFHEFQSRARRQAYVAIERRLGRITDVALCVGAGVAAEAVRRELIAPDRIATIGVSVAGSERARAIAAAGSPLARQRARITLGIPAEATVVGAVGRLTYQKAPEDFLAALELLDRPGTVGVWVGGGEAAAQISRRARRLRGSRVILAGERSDVVDILPAFDVFVLPSRYEGLPTVVVEAMLCGIPVIATAVNAVPDLVVPGETGMLIPPRRPAVLAAAIRYLLDFPAVADRLAATARTRVGGRYGESDLLEALLSAYRPGALAASAPPASAARPAGPRGLPRYERI